MAEKMTFNRWKEFHQSEAPVTLRYTIYKKNGIYTLIMVISETLNEYMTAISKKVFTLCDEGFIKSKGNDLLINEAEFFTEEALNNYLKKFYELCCALCNLPVMYE